MRKDFLPPLACLGLICLFISLALALTNEVTAPIIAQAEEEQARAARMEVLPQADDFTPVEGEFTGAVTQVFAANNGTGYVFMLEAKGYNGIISMLCGIDETGKLTGSRTITHGETPNLGSKITNESFYSQFDGKDAALDGVDTITGATKSSAAYIRAIEDAFAAWQQIEGVTK